MMPQYYYAVRRQKVSGVAIAGAVLSFSGLVCVGMWVIFASLLEILALFGLVFLLIGFIGAVCGILALIFGVIGAIQVAQRKKAGGVWAIIAITLGLVTVSWAAWSFGDTYWHLRYPDEVAQAEQARFEDILENKIDIRIGDPVIDIETLSGSVPLTITNTSARAEHYKIGIEEIRLIPNGGYNIEHLYVRLKPGQTIEDVVFELDVDPRYTSLHDDQRKRLRQLETSTFSVVSIEDLS